MYLLNVIPVSKALHLCKNTGDLSSNFLVGECELYREKSEALEEESGETGCEMAEYTMTSTTKWSLQLVTQETTKKGG